MKIRAVILVTLSSVHAWSDTPPLRFPPTADSTSTKPLTRSGHDNDAFKAAFTSCPQEIPPTVLPFPDLPTDFPVGTCYRNGHGRFESDDGMPTLHMFDGDGLVSAITFDSARILFRNRFVRTDGYVSDRTTGTMSRPGVFGTRVSGGWIQNIARTDVKNSANTNVLYSNGVLYALWESGWPYRLDPLTLQNDVEAEPKGFDMNGLLDKQDAFAAHYRYDPVTNHIVNFGVSMDPVAGTTTVYLYELDQDMNSVRDHEVSVVLEGAGLIHDFALTQHWHIFSVPTASVNNVAVLKALLGLGAFCNAVDFRDETLIVCVPRHVDASSAAKMKMKHDDRIKVIKVPSHVSYHCANAFECNDGHVVFDVILMDKINMGTTFSTNKPIWETVDWDKDVICPRYVRFTVNPESEEMVLPPKVITSRAPELPAIPKELSTRQHRYAYTVGSHKELDLAEGGSGAAGAILKVDTQDPDKTEAYSFLPHEFVGEPIFVAKVGADVTKDEDKGYVVVYVVNGLNMTTDLVILDVEGPGKLEEGPKARLTLPTYIPPGLHGTFVDGLSFDF